MAQSAWLRFVEASQLAALREEFEALDRHITQEQEAPKLLADNADADFPHRVARATLCGIEACRKAGDEPTREILIDTLAALLRRKIPFTATDLDQLVQAVEAADKIEHRLALLPGVLAALQRSMVSAPLDPERRPQLLSTRGQLETLDKKRYKTAVRLIEHIDKLCSDSLLTRLHADGGWADDLRVWVQSLVAPERQRWETFLQHVGGVVPEPPARHWRVEVSETGLDPLADWDAAAAACHRMQLARLPSAVWRETMAQQLETLGRERVADRLEHWLHQVPRSKPGMLARESLNRELLRGLLWLCLDLPPAELAQAVQRAASWFYENNSPLGETAVAVLCHLPGRTGAAPLATIRQRVKAESQRRYLDSALTFLAEREGIDRDELCDETLPTFGFTEFAALSREFDEARVQLRILANGAAELTWHNAQNKLVKSVPAKVRREHADELQSLKATVSSVREALAGLALRLESSWLAEKTLGLANWRERLIDHPVAGVVGRRLIWQFQDGGRQLAAVWHNGRLIQSDGQWLQLPADTQVELWHPLGVASQQVLAWREWLEENQVSQPFKQAHREIYLLTDAERATHVYSNRFAAHILRQAQFRQLAKIRGWKTDLVGPWDDGMHKAAQRLLPRWDLRAEFWVDGAGEEYQTGYTYVATDQVRFYRLREVEPIPLEAVPALVFSEVMRDVDLFIGVASIGNDPNWLDGGPQQRYRDYWHDFSFGDLSATAQTRKDVLARLVPRLKIARRCSLDDRCLIVRGDLRTYKIHLGSGNILMSPNDRYLCIVPKRDVPAADEQIALPFEGDALLSIILSKAFLLADDTKIVDESIKRQIQAD